MFEINGTIVIFITSFLLFVFLLNQVMLKPVGKVLDERAAQISSDVEAGKQSQAEAKQVRERYEQRIHAARLEAQAMINEVSTQAQKKRDAELELIKAKGRQQVAEAKQVIDGEKQALLESMIDQEIELVTMISSRVLGRPMTVSLNRSLVRQALEEAS